MIDEHKQRAEESSRNERQMIFALVKFIFMPIFFIGDRAIANKGVEVEKNSSETHTQRSMGRKVSWIHR
jgi:hypothetical protein